MTNALEQPGQAPAHIPTMRLAPQLSWKLDATIIALLPFIQLGLSYYLSVATLLAVLVVVRLRRQIAIGLRERPWALLLVLPMILSLLGGVSQDLPQDVLRIAREGLIAVLLIAVFAGSVMAPVLINVRRLATLIGMLVFILLGLTAVQGVALRGGLYLGFTKDLYMMGQGTIPGTLDLYYSHIRPAATFSEPSYLAFILLSLLMVLAARFERDRRGAVSGIAAVISGVLSQAASFGIFSPLIVLITLLRTARGMAKILHAMFIVLLGATVILVGSEMGMFSRIENALSPAGDFSIFVRIVGPLQVLPDYLGRNPIGTPALALPDLLQHYTNPIGIDPTQYLMNSAYNLLFQYGFGGVPVLIALLWHRDMMKLCYVLASMLFNGSFLAPDKLAVICFTMMVYDSIRSVRPHNTAMRHAT